MEVTLEWKYCWPWFLGAFNESNAEGIYAHLCRYENYKIFVAQGTDLMRYGLLQPRYLNFALLWCIPYLKLYDGKPFSYPLANSSFDANTTEVNLLVHSLDIIKWLSKRWVPTGMILKKVDDAVDCNRSIGRNKNAKQGHSTSKRPKRVKAANADRASNFLEKTRLNISLMLRY